MAQLADVDYGVISGYPSGAPVVTVLFHPIYAGADYQVQAVIDSGSAYTFVPFGEPAKHGWLEKGLPKAHVATLGGKPRLTRRFVARVKLYTEEFSVPVCELWQDVPWTHALIGLDFLQFVTATLDGPGQHLRIDG